MLEAFDIVARAVADPSRVRILKLLQSGELCVCQITAVLDLASATISKHLGLLRSSGLVQQRREGKWIYYRLAEHEMNAYARPFLALVKDALAADATIATDLELFKRVQRTPIQAICDQGRAALGLDGGCCESTPTRHGGLPTSPPPPRSTSTVAKGRRQSRRSP